MSRTLTDSDRSSLIRIAYANPNLRSTLLPLLADSGGARDERGRKQVLAARDTHYYFTVIGEGKKSYLEVERELRNILKREGWSKVEIHDEMRDEHEDA